MLFSSIVFQSLLNRKVQTDSESDISLTDSQNDDLQKITEEIKTKQITKLIVGGDYYTIPSFDGLSFVKIVEIQSQNIDTIEPNTFKDNRNIQKVILTANVQYILDNAFENSTISEINLENVVEIAREAFKNCKFIQTPKLSQLRTLGSSAFENTPITELKFIDEMTSIPARLCYNCRNLTTVESNAQDISDYAFYNCTSLSKITYSKNLYWFGFYVLAMTKVEELYFGNRIPDLNLVPLKKLIIGINNDNYKIPDLPILKIIEFTKDCKIINLRNLHVEEVIFPSDPDYRYSIDITNYNLKEFPPGLETVNFVANMPELEKVDLTYCTYIKRNSFFNCPKLKEIIGWGEHSMTVESSLFELCPLINIKTWTNQINISSQVNGYDDNNGVLSYTYITEMTIKGFNSQSYDPKFYCCKDLKKVVIEEGSGLTYIASYQFANCTSLSEVTLSSEI